MPQEKRPPIIYIIPILVILIVVGVAGYILYNRLTSTTNNPPSDLVDNTFTPFGDIPVHSTTTRPTQATTTENTPGVYSPKSTLRLLSATPVGGYGASTTASTTIVRWVDRGRGNIREARYNNENIFTISNTLIQKIYDSVWNKDLTAFIAPTVASGATEAQTIYVNLKARITTDISTTTASSSTTSTTTSAGGISFVAQTPYELRGSDLPAHIISYATSPKRDKIFFLVNEGGYGVGYTASFDGKSVTKIFSTPATQFNSEWPEENTIALTTKGSATYAGFLYFINPKTGAWKKIIGPILGLSTRVSHDAKYVLASSAENDSVSTAIYNISTQKYAPAIIRTLADKCAWGNFDISMVYCATPGEPVLGLYPDDWYRGVISTADKIWQLSASSGEIHLVSSIVDQSDRVIDAFNLGLDPKDEFLFFMNKNDLSLWSLDLVVGNIR